MPQILVNTTTLPCLDRGKPVGVLRVAQRADPRDDIEAKRMLGEGQPPLGFGAVRAPERRTGAVKTTPNVEGEMHHVFQSGDGAIVMIGRPHRRTAAGAMTPTRLEGAGCRWGRTRRRTCH